jgi:hypothetical protein
METHGNGSNRESDYKRLCFIIGAVMVEEAKKDAELFGKITRMLSLLVRDEQEREFLSRLGWIENE